MKHYKVVCDLTQMCRLCLSQDNIITTGVYLFSSESEPKIADIIMECAPVHITRHDKMPAYICRSCFAQLKKFHQFQRQVIQSDKTLQHYLQQMTDCHTQIKGLTLEEQPDTSSNQTSNTDVNKRCEPFEISNGFDICHSKQNETANSNAVSRNTEEIFFKSEIKDEPIDDNSLLPTEWADETAESVSNDDGSGTPHRYLQPMSVCHPQVEVELALEEHSNNSKSQNYNADVTTKCEPSEMSDKFDLRYSNKKMPSKSKIKDEPMEDNSLIPTEWAEDGVENLSKDDGINCEVSMVVINDTKAGVNTSEIFQYSLNFENDVTEKSPLKKDKSQEGADSSPFPGNLRKKRTIHTGEKSFKCDVCKMCFRQAHNLKSHKLKHTGEKPYQCDICKKCFRLSQNLKSHRLKHTGEKPYQCDICKMCFRLSQDLRSHKLKHTGEKPYHCDICKMHFRLSQNLKMHKLKHTGEKPHQCDICKTCFSRPQYLKKHTLKHTGEKPYQCDICKMRFRHSNSLKRHVQKHTGEKPYRCDICQMCFIQACQLKSHTLIHTGEKPFQCEICQMCFRHASTLKRHNLKHTGEKPYRCDICQMCFRQTVQLKSHKLKHAEDSNASAAFVESILEI